MKRFVHYLLLMCIVPGAWAQVNSYSGTVLSADDRSPLVGVSVIIENSTEGTITDADGKFSINANSGNRLEFSSIGYKTQFITLGSQRALTVLMEVDSKVLDEVVAVGYGTMKRSDLTGAISSVKAEQLQKTPAAGLDQALQGRASGVTVNASSGQPGADAEVRIRGIGTINGNDPIYVVDGVITKDIKFVSPSDIESIEVLKDASSSAIYGARAANGVILVTTKKGKEGRTNVSFNGYVGIQNRWNKLSLMSSKEHAETMINMANVQSEKNFYNNNGFNAWLKAYRLGSSPYYPTGYDYASVETDWQDAVFKKNALVHNYSLSIDGASEKMKYSLSASYFNQDGTIIGSNYQRLTIRANSELQVNKWLKVGENISYMHAEGRNAMNNNSSPGASILSAALAMAPWDPTHYSEGSVNIAGKDLSNQIAASSNFKNVVNPFSMVQNSHPLSKQERWVGNVFMDITPIKGLVLRSDISMDLANTRDRLFKDAYEYSSFDKADKNFLSSSMSRNSYLTWTNTGTYAREIGKHSFSALIGQSVEEVSYYSIGGSGSRILNPTENNWYLNQTTEDQVKASDSASRTRRFSLFSRLFYSYASRYMITANFRADGSSNFPRHPYGYFPSFSAAWRISEEPWMESANGLDNLKLRFGWGRVGNDQVGGSTFVQTMFNSGPTFVDYVFGSTQALASGAAVLIFVDEDGKWETTETINLGIDFGILGNKLTGTLELFQRNTLDMILPVNAPAIVGNRYASSKNIGNVSNTGIELELNYQNTIGKVNYSIGGNVSFIKNELTKLNGGSKIYSTYQIIDEGLPLYSFWGYEYEGIYRSDSEAWQHLFSYSYEELPSHAGDAKYKDLNNDGKIDDNDKTYLGNPFPWLTYGLNLGADAYGFDLQLFFQGVYGNKIANTVRVRTEGKGTEATLSTAMRDVWMASNPEGSIPNPYTSNNFYESSRFIESGAYLRLKNVQLGYTFPSKWMSKASINRLRLYVSASNLFTLTGYTGYDPEVGGGIDYGNYPQSRTFTFGVNVDF